MKVHLFGTLCHWKAPPPARYRVGMSQELHDVVILGAGAAGVAAAIAAARAGCRTLLVEAGPWPGGELLSGMPVDGAVNARGEWIMGGAGRELFAECERLGGYIGPVNDHRLIHYVAFDPEVMKLAVASVLARHGVRLLLHTFAHGVEREGPGRVRALQVIHKGGQEQLRGRVFLDCSGDGDLCTHAGAPVLRAERAALQPVSLMFRMSGVETRALLDFQCAHPEHFALGESDAIRAGRTDAELAAALREAGHPAAFLKGDGPLLHDAFATGELFPTALIMIQPTAPARREVCLNATRVAGVDALDPHTLSRTLPELVAQVGQCAEFLRRRVPGFAHAAFAGAAPRLGIRETRRIRGEAFLTGDEVRHARKHADGVAKGCHHIDLHQSGTGQVRIPVAGGGSYDIPWGCLLPQGLQNVAMAGRCISADREANGSLRVMGSCLAMGQAVGTAAALACESGGTVREVGAATLRTRLREAGAVLDGVA